MTQSEFDLEKASQHPVKAGIELVGSYLLNGNALDTNFLIKGKVNQAWDFKNGQEISVGSPDVLDNIWDGGGTLSCWVNIRTEGAGGNGRIMDKRDTGGGWTLFVNDVTASVAEVRFFHDFNTTDGIWKLDCAINTDNHIAVVYDKNSASNLPVLYLNGVAQTGIGVQTPVGTALDDSASDFSFGKGGVTNYYNGTLQDVAVYKRALSQDEITLLYNNGNGLEYPFRHTIYTTF